MSDVEIRMPDLSPTDREVTLLRWHVEIGQPVALGQPLLEVETAKAVMDVEAVAAGVLREVRAAPGESVPVGDVVAVIASGRPATSRPAPAQRRLPPRQAAPPAAPATIDAPGPASPRTSMFARNRERRAALAGAPTAVPAEARSAAALPAFRMTASARVSGDPRPDEVAAAAIRAMASALGLTGSGVRVMDAAGERTIGAGAARAALLLAAVDGAAAESFHAEADLPVLAVAPARETVVATGPGQIAVERRLPLALSVAGAPISPADAARFLDSLVTELEQTWA